MTELNKPSWRNVDAFKNAISRPNVTTALKEELAAKHSKKHPLIVGNTPIEEVNHFFPRLINDVRIFDVNDLVYWVMIAVIVIIYFLFQALLLNFYSEFVSKHIITTNKITSIYVISTISIIVYILGIVLVYAIRRDYFEAVRDKLSNYTSLIRTIPVIIASLTLIGTTAILVARSGYSNSPFLPSLLYIATATIAAPRENTPTTIILSIIASILMGYFVYKEEVFTVEQADQEALGRLSLIVNLLTLIFTVSVTMIVRSFTSMKIKIQ